MLNLMDLALLKKVALFEGLTSHQLQKISNLAVTRHFDGSEYIFKEGDPGNAMYVIAEGRIRISKTVPGVGEEALAILEKGQYFGEMALIDGAPRSATARAKTDCEVAPINEKTFLFLVHETPFFAIAVMRTLAGRLRHMNET